MPRFEPAPEDDHVGRDFEGFPGLAAALDDLAKPKPLASEEASAAAHPGRLTPEEVEARLAASESPEGAPDDESAG